MTSSAYQWKLIGDEWDETFLTQTDLIDSHLVWEAFEVTRNGIDAVADTALVWWRAHGEPGGNIPELFEAELSIISMNAAEAGYSSPNAEHSTLTKGVGI